MPRRARVTLAGIPHHIIQRGNNRAACFYCEDDYLFYLACLKQYCLKYECYVHSFCLMTNHVHLLVTPSKKESLANMMKSLGQRYVQYINRTYVRTGTLWEGRFKSCIANEDKYILACYRYIELNPVRASMVEHPAEYRWTSYRCNAQGELDELITPHTCFLNLASSVEARMSSYKSLFESSLNLNLINQIRTATQSNYALGSELFKREVSEALGRRVSCGKAGRPIIKSTRAKLS